MQHCSHFWERCSCFLISQRTPPIWEDWPVTDWSLRGPMPTLMMVAPLAHGKGPQEVI